MSTPSDISAKTTHDLWVDARQFTIDVARPTSTSIMVTVKRPAALTVADGAVILLSEKPIGATNYPKDGEAYAADEFPNWNNPIHKIGDAQVIGAFHAALSNPFPTTEALEANAVVTGFPSTFQVFTITVEGTNPNAIYYASVHASSNILQYYPIGVQSYPISGALVERGGGTYTGNIPSYPTAPTSPVPGMVYHDQVLNVVQYYDGSAWIPTPATSIMSGPYNPGILGQGYLFGGSLRIFDGIRWVKADSSNIMFRPAGGGSSWLPMRYFSTRVDQPSTGEPGDVYYDFTVERLFYHNGSTWVSPHTGNALLKQNGADPVIALGSAITVEPEELRNPYIGQLFYNTTTQELNAWNGKSWNKVNTDQEGEATSNKIGVGNDGSYDERIALIKVLNGQLGWPQLCVELQEEQFNIAIDNALDNYRQLSSGAYKRSFVLFKLRPGQQKYYLNSAIDKTDHIVDIHKIHRMGPLGIHGGGPNDTWAHAFAQQYYDFARGSGDMLTTHLVAAYSEDLSRMFAGELMFQWDEPSHELYILRSVRGHETVIIEAMLERSEQEILMDRWCKQYIQNWALAELKMMLGLIRSKFASGTPGPGGTINLNGEMLVAEARQDMMELKEEILNYEYGGMIGHGNVSFLIG